MLVIIKIIYPHQLFKKQKLATKAFGAVPMDKAICMNYSAVDILSQGAKSYVKASISSCNKIIEKLPEGLHPYV